jgi:hypothetical protein
MASWVGVVMVPRRSLDAVPEMLPPRGEAHALHLLGDDIGLWHRVRGYPAKQSTKAYVVLIRQCI